MTEQKNVSTYMGLTDAEVLESRAKYGANVLTPPAKVSLWRLYLKKFSDPLIIILLVAGVLSVGISCYEFFGLHESLRVFFEPLGIFIAIMLATGLAFLFELKADREFAVLNKVNDDEPVQVYRNGNAVSIARRDVVVGDILILSTGQEVPADAELIDAVSMRVDESSLTGEPVCHKGVCECAEASTYPANHVMRGTKVMEGHGVARVFAVGDATENGKVFEASQIDSSVRTPLNEQLDRLGMLITNLSYTIAGLIIVGKLLVYFDFSPLALLLAVPTGIFFYLVIFRFRHWRSAACIAAIVLFFVLFIASVLGLHALLNPELEVSHLLAYSLQTIMIAVTLIVVAVPEGLPMAVTLSLAYSMSRMLQTNNLVRKMHACETMGAATVICTDKTGTLTQNQMQVADAMLGGSEGLQLFGQEHEVGGESLATLLAESVALNTTACLGLADGGLQVLGNPTEGALLLWLHQQCVDYNDVRQSAERLGELPFDTSRKYMATLCRTAAGRVVLLVKGAPEIVMAMCGTMLGGTSEADYRSRLQLYQNKAMRTLGFAYKVVDDDEKLTTADIAQMVEGLVFIGIVAIADPVRDDVPAAVKECMDAGIKVKIVTGDTVGTAREIGRQIGLWDDADGDENIITGPEFAELTDEQLAERVGDLKIIARARPMDKKRLVEALQARGEVVAVTGDGTNDAPALKAAHVGLSMGDGTSVAKEASDITIIDNSFSSIGRAVMWGRSLYQNIQRFLLFQLTVNVAACLLVLVGSFFGTESPLTVTQMLWVNLFMDTFGAMALSSLPPSPKVMQDRPRNRRDFILNRSMMRNIAGVGGVFFLIMLVFLFIFRYADITCLTDLAHLHLGQRGAITPYEQTLLFSIFVFTHFWYMFDARGYNTGASGLNLRHCSGFWWIAGIIFFGQILIVELMYDFFNVVPMKFVDWVIIVAASSLVLWVREIKVLLTRWRSRSHRQERM